MKFVSLLFSCWCGIVSYCQQSQKCELIDALLKHEKAKKGFYFESHPEVPIVIVDTGNFFKDCSISGDYYGRKVEIVHNESDAGAVNYSNVIVNSISTSKSNKFRLTVFYKVRNAFFVVDLKKKRRRIVVSKFSGGHF